MLYEEAKWIGRELLKLSKPGYRILNIGNSKSVSIKKILRILSQNLNTDAKIKLVYKQKGDVYKTQANTLALEKITKFKLKTDIKLGLQKFSDWFVSYYG